MRRLAFALVATACVLVAGSYVAYATLYGSGSDTSDGVVPEARATLERLGVDATYVVFQNARRDDDYARIALASKNLPRRRIIAGRACERVYFASARALCLVPVQGSVYFQFAYEAVILDGGLEQRGQVELPGIISRARISPDGRYGATTGFVTGHSYRDKGFSTYTALIDMNTGSKITDLERFTVTRDGKTIRSPDFNFWGVTFARASDRFYATLSTRGKTYLVVGSVRGRHMRVLHENVECPSLSPDETRVAYKKREGKGWRLSVLDLSTMRETPLAEARSVDDQAEWLDDEHVLYGLGADVWRVRADGTGRPALFLRDALSPAVVPAHSEAPGSSS